jgi:hypothetical protein
MGNTWRDTTVARIGPVGAGGHVGAGCAHARDYSAGDPVIAARAWRPRDAVRPDGCGNVSGRQTDTRPGQRERRCSGTIHETARFEREQAEALGTMAASSS